MASLEHTVGSGSRKSSDLLDLLNQDDSTAGVRGGLRRSARRRAPPGWLRSPPGSPRGLRRSREAFDPSSTDEPETELCQGAKPAPPKVSSAKRGGTHAVGLSRALACLRDDDSDEYFEDDLAAVSAATGPADVGLDAADLLGRALSDLGKIDAVTRKSRNLKGSCVKEVRDAITSLQSAVEALATRSTSTEVARLRAENARMAQELEALKAETKAIRHDFHARAPSPPTDSDDESLAPIVRADVAPVPYQLTERGLDAKLEEWAVKLHSSIGGMVRAQIEGLKIPDVRPPLAADKRKAGAASYAGIVREAAAPPQPKTLAAPVGPSRESLAPTQQAPPGADEDGEWTVVSNHRGRKTSKSALSTKAPKPAPKAAPKKPRLAEARTAAIVVALTPEAVNRGVTYANVLEKARRSIDLQAVGVSSLSCRTSATGTKILEIPGVERVTLADRLAGQLRTVLADEATVVRPTKFADVRIGGLDDSVPSEEVASFVAAEGSCAVEQVRAGPLRPEPGGTCSVMVRCPVSVAKCLVGRRLLIGWSATRARVLEPRPMRCFKCMGTGHTRPLCPSAVDRSSCCFRCGNEGHVSVSCQVAEPRCGLCASLGRPAGHVMGGRKCNPPPTKAKPTGLIAVPNAAAPTRDSPRLETAEMSA